MKNTVELLGFYIDESRYKGIIKSYDTLADMVFKYIEKLKQNSCQ